MMMKKFIVCAGLAFFVGVCFAETRTWQIDAEASWATAAYWGGTLPGDADTAVLSKLTGAKTISLDGTRNMASFVYNPEGTGNVLTLSNGALATTTTIEIGEGATVIVPRYLLSNTNVRKLGKGELRILESFTSGNGNQRLFYPEKGTVRFAEGCKVTFIQFFGGTSADDTDSEPAKVVLENNASIDMAKVNDFEFGRNYTHSGTGRFAFEMNGGTILVNNAINGGCFLNAVGYHNDSTKTYVYRTYSEMNINGGLIDGSNKTFYPSFRGTGVVNQTAGVVKFKEISFSVGGIGKSIYNLRGGELYCATWNRNSANNEFAVWNAKIVKTGNSNIDVNTPFYVHERLELEVPTSSETSWLTARMEGAGSFVKTGPGTFRLESAEKNFSGDVICSNGVLKLDAHIPNSKNLLVADTGTALLCTGKNYGFTTIIVKDNAKLEASAGMSMPTCPITLTDNAKLVLPAGTYYLPTLLRDDGAVLANGVYTAEDGFIEGDGKLLIGPLVWTGNGDGSNWNDAANWTAGITPYGGCMAIDISAATGTLVVNEPVTNAGIALAPQSAKNIVISGAKLYFANGTTIKTTADSSLEFRNNGAVLGARCYKSGVGSVAFTGRFDADSPNTSHPIHYLFSFEGTTVIDCPSASMGFYVGNPDTDAYVGTPELELRENAQLEGNTLLGVLAFAEGTARMGQGKIIQSAGTIHPYAVGYGTSVSLGAIPAGVSTRPLATYQLDGGRLEISAGKNIICGTSGSPAAIVINDGVLHNEGNFIAQSGNLTMTLNGGALEIANALTASACGNLILNSGIFAPLATSVSVASTLSMTGDAEITVEEGRTLAFTGTIADGGSFHKTGAGTVVFPTGVAFGTIGITNGLVNLSGVNTAEKFYVAGEEMAPGVYTAENCSSISGNGQLVIGAEPGTWIGTANDGKWSSTANWSASVIPNGAALDVDLSKASGSLSFDMGTIELGSLKYAPTDGTKELVNTASATTDEMLVHDGCVIIVEEGCTLTLDHKVRMTSSISAATIWKRGKGTLVFNQGVTGDHNNAGWDWRVAVEEGKVINNGAMVNISGAAGAPTKVSPEDAPEFIQGENGSMTGYLFLRIQHPTSTTPGNGIFTQNGGLVEPGISWANRVVLGMHAQGTEMGSTGIYNIVNGTLRLPADKDFCMGLNGGRGVMNIYNGGLFDNGKVNLGLGVLNIYEGGECRPNAWSVGGEINFYGGKISQVQPTTLSSNWYVLHGVGEINVASGQTLYINAADALRGEGTLRKSGAGRAVFNTVETCSAVGDIEVTGGTLGISNGTTLYGITNAVVSSGAILQLFRTGATQFNEKMTVRVEEGGKIDLSSEGQVCEVNALILGGVPMKGQGTTYGGSAAGTTPDVVKADWFTGKGLLKVTGNSAGAGTVIVLL